MYEHMMAFIETSTAYEQGEQTLYLGELALMAIGFFVAGFLLLFSKREKDRENKFYGWVFYGIGFICVALMWFLVLSFS